MASLKKYAKSPYYFAYWRDLAGKERTKSTKIKHTPAKGAARKESPAQLRARAQLVAEAFEEADKEGMEGAHVRAALEVLSQTERKPDAPSVRDFADVWADERAALGSGSLASDKRALALLSDYLGERMGEPIDKLSKADMQALVIREVGRVSASTVQRYMQSLSTLFNAAIDRELITKNPCHGLKYPRGSAHDKFTRKPFTRDDIRTLLERLPKDWASMVMVSLHLGGQRLGDCALLKWQDVDFKLKCVSLVTQKTRRGHAVPMTKTLEAHLLALRAESQGDYIHADFAARYLRTGSSQHLSLEFSALVEALGLSSREPVRDGERRSFRDKTFHSLRASAVTMLHDAGVPLSMAMLIVGHNNADIHRVYYRPDNEAIRESLENLDV